MISYRQKDDPYNAVVGGFVTGGLLSIRGGASVACKQAMMGGMILLIIEGVSGVFSGCNAQVALNDAGVAADGACSHESDDAAWR